MRDCLRSFVIATLLVGCSCAAAPEPHHGRDGGDPQDDSGAMHADSGPGSGDICDNGLDDDGDGSVDEECACAPGATQRCFGGDPALAGVGACEWGNQRCASDFEIGYWDVCEGYGVPSDELCDGVDNDCDGETDEGCDCTPGAEVECYDGAPITEGVGSCIRGVVRCVVTETGSAWTGCEGSVGPADEVCDGAGDEDCDGLVDEGCACLLGESHACYGGAPGTEGVGECRAGTQSCVDGSSGPEWTTCTDEVRPRTESCTGGRDEDCDGRIDCEDSDCAASCCTPWDTTVPVVPAEGEILFLVDRSGSMDWPAVGTTRTRWQELLDAMTSVLPMVDHLPMGLLTFPRMTGTSETGNCMVASSPDVGITLGSRTTILSRLVAADPRAGDTPTPGAFGTAQSYLTSTSSTRERFIILATDGLPEPNCGATVDATVTAIANIRATLGIDTFVIGIVGPDASGDRSGIPALQAGLNRMADAGGRPRAGSIHYYEAVDGAALSSALTAIIAAATDCQFELSSAPPRPSRIEVREGTTLVPASSYTLTGTHLEIRGTYCDRIRAGLVGSITVTDSCAP